MTQQLINDTLRLLNQVTLDGKEGQTIGDAERLLRCVQWLSGMGAQLPKQDEPAPIRTRGAVKRANGAHSEADNGAKQ